MFDPDDIFLKKPTDEQQLAQPTDSIIDDGNTDKLVLSFEDWVKNEDYDQRLSPELPDGYVKNVFGPDFTMDSSYAVDDQPQFEVFIDQVDLNNTANDKEPELRSIDAWRIGIKGTF